MSETEVTSRIKRYWIITTIVIAIILAASNLLAQKLFYEDRINGYEKRMATAELKLEQREIADAKYKEATLKALTTIDLNVREICKKNKLDYIELPKVYE